MHTYHDPQVQLMQPQIGINLSDPIFRGVYHGKRAHEDDLDGVIERAQSYGVKKFMVTGSDLTESQRAVDIAREYRMQPVQSCKILRRHLPVKVTKGFQVMQLTKYYTSQDVLRNNRHPPLQLLHLLNAIDR